MLAERGLTPVRKNLSDLANELMANYPGGILCFSYERAKKEGVKNYLLEAIHRVSEAEYVRSIGGVIIAVDAHIDVRYERISKRKEGEKDNVTYEQFLEDAAREDDGATGTGPNIRAVLSIADFVIMNNGTLEELQTEIERFLTTYGVSA
jgi:dephospho-CoA kinase